MTRKVGSAIGSFVNGEEPLADAKGWGIAASSRGQRSALETNSPAVDPH